VLDAARRIEVGARVEPLRPGESAASVVEPATAPGTEP
jgi:hypothetical protein